MKQDAELVLQSSEGNVFAFETLVDRWAARVASYTEARVRNPHVAEEISQETFLIAFRSLKKLHNPDKFGAWILSIAHRKCLDWLKSKRRTESTLAEPSSVVGSQPMPGDSLERNEYDSQLRNAIFELPLELREVLLIFYFDGATYNEMAGMLGVSIGTVNARLAKARNQLRAQLAGLEN